MIVVATGQRVEIVYRGPRDPKTQEVTNPIPESEWPRFSCRVLTASEYVQLMDEGMRGATGGLGLQLAAPLLKACRWCLKDWGNVKGSDGEDIPWPGNSGQAVDMLPGNVVIALGADILEMAALHETDREK